jgi:outer membrane protein assembly factor BamB
MMLRPLNRFGRDVREGAADVAIAGKRAVFVQGARVTAADVNSPAVPWSFMVEGTTPADPPSMSNILLTAVGQRLAYPAYSGNRPVIIAFDAQTGLNVRAGRGFTGLTSTTYFKNLLVMADGKRSFAVDLDRLMPLHRKPAEAPAESKAEE